MEKFTWQGLYKIMVILLSWKDYLHLAHKFRGPEGHVLLTHCGLTTMVLQDLDEVKAFHPVCATPLPEPVLNYCQLNPQEQMSEI